MMKRVAKIVTIVLLNLVLISMVTTGALAAQDSPRTTAELEKDLRETKREFKQFKNLSSKLESAGRQSSNASRQKVMKNIQEFMGQCIQRREKDLGQDLTIKQHGQMVTSGTTDVAHYDSSKPGTKGKEGDSERLRQLSGMKSIYVSAKNNSQPASERQGNAFERYTETMEKFGKQLEWGVNSMSNELDKREAEAAAKAEQP